MFDIAILGQVALGYSPFIDRKRNVMATRLTVFALRPGSRLDAGELLHAVAGVWPAGGARVSLNVTSESLLHDLLRTAPPTNVMVEVPAFMAADEANVDVDPAPAPRRRRAADQGPAADRAAARDPAVLPLFDHRLRRRPSHRRCSGPRRPA